MKFQVVVKYLVSIGFVVLISTLLYRCTTVEEDSRNKPLETHNFDLPEIYKRGKIIVLAENSSASFFIYKGRKMGFEYDVLKEFAEDLGVKLEVKIVPDLNRINQMLQQGEGDIIACNYTVTKDRKDSIDFSVPILQTTQVIVQRKKNYSFGNEHTTFINEPLELAKKKVFVWNYSSYYTRLIHLQNEIGDTIYIQPTTSDEGVEELIEQVSNGTIDYTISERNIAEINAHFYDNIDASVPISFKQNIAFGLNKKSPILQKRINTWLTKFMKSGTFKFIKKKYFSQLEKTVDGNFSFKPRKGSISPFDQILRKEGAKYDIDWRLVAAIIYHESKFNPNARAFGGAYGLMQFMPGTGPKFGVYPSSSPEVQIKGGFKYLNRIEKIWKNVNSIDERMKFMLASYNAGAGHIIDAQKLAKKHGLNPNKWNNNVETMCINLGKHEYYTDPIVKSGAFRGKFTANYVKKIFERYSTYKELVKK
jgi:membrane-bound lytic murein transglycosylase F